MSAAAAAGVAGGEPRDQDEAYMGRALELAGNGVALCSPNPMVGCVLVQSGAVLGEGWHEYDRRDHAEIVALRAARVHGGALGATAYVTLEPCSHTGRTGPCADALIAAGVSRAVIATADPNPLVHGNGIRRLRAAGVAVRLGCLERPARRLNDGFARFMRSGLPFVTMKVAMSREGAIARLGTPPGTVLPVTSEASRSRVAALRHRQDAVLTGIGTVLADDPLLTDRSGGRRRRRLLRVVLDSRLRLPLGSRLVATAEDDLLVFTRQEDSAAAAMLRARGVEVLGIGEAGTAGTGSDAGGPGRAESSLPGAAAPGLDLGAVLRELARRGLENVLVEAGTALNTALLNGRHVDRLLVIRSPRDLGGGGIPAFGRLHGPLPLPPPEEGLPDPDSGDAVHDLLLSDPWPAEGM